MIWRWLPNIKSKQSARIKWRSLQWSGDKNQNFCKHFHQSLWADVAWVTPCFHSTPGLCVVQGVRNLTMRGNGVWSLWQTIGQKWRLKCFALSLVIGNYRKKSPLEMRRLIIIYLLLYGCCFAHFLFPFYPWFVCCPGGSECDHAWKWSVVDVTDRQI